MCIITTAYHHTLALFNVSYIHVQIVTSANTGRWSLASMPSSVKEVPTLYPSAVLGRVSVASQRATTRGHSPPAVASAEHEVDPRIHTRVPRAVEPRERRKVTGNPHARRLRPEVVQQIVVASRRHLVLLRERLVDGHGWAHSRRDLVCARVVPMRRAIEVSGNDDGRGGRVCLVAGAREEHRRSEAPLRVRAVVEVRVEEGERLGGRLEAGDLADSE